MNILNKIVEKTKLRTQNLNLEELRALSKNIKTPSFRFFEALNKNSNNIKIIAEIKQASPSKGIIARDFNPKEIAKEYKEANVDCISILTEPFFFKGDNSYIKMAKETTSKPILRKDFILDEAQIYESKIIGADCILLICAILDEIKLKHFLNIAYNLGLDALVETRNIDEIKMAIESKARIIGVNNRNLDTFNVDTKKSVELRKFVPNNIIFVSESGIKTREDILTLEQANVNAVLIGETFMRATNKTEEIKKLRGEI